MKKVIQPRILTEIGNSSTPKLHTRFYVKISLAKHHNHQTDRFGAVKVMCEDVKAKIEDLVRLGITKPSEIQLLLNEFVELLIHTLNANDNKFTTKAEIIHFVQQILHYPNCRNCSYVGFVNALTSISVHSTHLKGKRIISFFF